MVEGIEPLYQRIAESIAQSIDGPWTTAWMDAIFFPGHNFYSGEYVSPGSGKHKSFDTDIAAERGFKEIRQLFKRAGKPLWCSARFELHSDGKFKMDWGYEDCDENGFAKFDEEKEAKRMKELRDRLA